MFWNYFGKPNDDLHHLTLGHFLLTQFHFHAPAQEYFDVLSVIQISIYSLSISTRLSLLSMLNKQFGDV